MTYQTRLSKILDKVIFVSLIALVPLATIPYGSIDPLWETALGSVIFFLAMLWFLHGVLSGELFIKQHIVLLPCVFLIAYAALQTIPFGQIEIAGAGINASKTISLDPYETRHVILRFAAYTLYGAMLLCYITNEKRLHWLIIVIVFAAAASALFGFYLQTTVRHQPDSLLPRIFSTRGFAQFINKNNFAYLMEMSAGLAVGLLIARSVNKSAKIFYAVALLVIIGGLIFSASRGGLLGLLIQTLFLGLFIAFFRNQPNNNRLISIASRFAIAFALVMAILIGVVWFGSDDLVKKIGDTPANFSVGQIEQNLSRKQIWQATLRLFKDNPTMGIGFGGYWIGVTNYDDTSGNLSLQQAHNDYLELLASGGIIGFLLVAWLAFMLAKEARLNLSSENYFKRAACCGALLGCMGVAVHSVFDFGLHVPIIALVFTALLVIAIDDTEKQFIQLSTPLRFGLAVVCICVSLFACWINVKRGSGRVVSEFVLRFSKANGDDPQTFLQLAQRAVDSAPNDPETHAAMAFLLEQTGDDGGAITSYEKAISFRSRDYYLWIKLGSARVHNGEFDKAINAFKEATNLAKPYARPKWLLGNALLRAGRRDEALKELKKAMQRDPLLVAQVAPIAWNVFGKDTKTFLEYINPQTEDEKLAVGKFLIANEKNNEGQELLFASGEKGKQEIDKIIAELFKQNRFREAHEIWSKSVDEKQIISNGSFESDINLDEKMFGWQVAQRTNDVNVALETDSPQDRKRALRVTYNNSNDVSAMPIRQLVIVKPNTKYRLSLFVKTQEIVSVAMPLISVNDVMTNKEIAVSKTFPATTNDWQKMEMEFSIDAKTEAIFISLKRETCTNNPCPIFGKLWLDSFELIAK
jgi:O-antigen ligase/tetratricopeptide (TPR) repeat protein